MSPFDEVQNQSNTARPARQLHRAIRISWFLISIAGLLTSWYLIGLLQNTPGSYAELKQGKSTSFVGTVTKVNKSSITVKTATDGSKRLATVKDTTYALFPKDYQTLIPVGLPSSNDDVVANVTEANVSARLGYLTKPQAVRVNLVRADVLTGKVIEVAGSSFKFKGFAATGAADETRTLAANVEYLKLSVDGTFGPAVQGDVKKDMGLYAFLDKPVTDQSGQITKLIVADFTSSAN